MFQSSLAPPEVQGRMVREMRGPARAHMTGRMEAWGEVMLVVGTRDSVARCRTGQVGKASPVGGANGRAEIRLSPRVRYMVEFVEQRSSVPYMAGRRGQDSLRMVEMEEWDSRHWRMVE